VLSRTLARGGEILWTTLAESSLRVPFRGAVLVTCLTTDRSGRDGRCARTDAVRALDKALATGFTLTEGFDVFETRATGFEFTSALIFGFTEAFALTVSRGFIFGFALTVDRVFTFTFGFGFGLVLDFATILTFFFATTFGFADFFILLFTVVLRAGFFFFTGMYKPYFRKFL